jgi:hypothetical protein
MNHLRTQSERYRHQASRHGTHPDEPDRSTADFAKPVEDLGFRTPAVAAQGDGIEIERAPDCVGPQASNAA